MTWEPDAAGLAALDESGGPYETSAYRLVCAEAVRGMRDVSVAARMEDGTCAAIALLRQGRAASSVPYGYGGVRASRRLSQSEWIGFLELALEQSGAWALDATWLGEGVGQGERIGTTRIVDVTSRPSDSLAKQTAYKVRRATRLGCRIERSADPGAFLRVYREASASWGVRYPESLVEAAAARSLARFYYVRDASGEIVSVLAALPSSAQWMYWFGAQLDAGRSVGGSYLTMSSMLEDAHEAGAETVNLGASEGLPGVAAFKARWGGAEAPVHAVRLGRPRAAALAGLPGRIRRRLG